MVELLLFFSASFVTFSIIEGQGGRMVEPMQRSGLWRLKEFDHQAPVNTKDDENNCGGFTTQFIENEGKCGTCGDNYAVKIPRKNENGGLYGTGQVVNRYKQGQNIKVKINLTTDHPGYFQFAICHLENPSAVETEECFDEHPLSLIDDKGETADKYHIGEVKGEVTVELFLPRNLTCERCVLRWHYRVGNKWGICDESKVLKDPGCADQKTYRNCADIAVD